MPEPRPVELSPEGVDAATYFFAEADRFYGRYLYGRYMETQERLAAAERVGNELADAASAYLYENEESSEETPLDRALAAWRLLNEAEGAE